MQQGLTFEEEKKAITKCSTLKIDFSANFNMIFFGGGSVNTPKIGKRKNNVTNINLRECKTQKNMRGVFVMDKTGHKIFVFKNAMVLTYNRELRLI